MEKVICTIEEVTPIGTNNQGYLVKFDTGRTVESAMDFRGALTAVLPAVVEQLEKATEKPAKK